MVFIARYAQTDDGGIEDGATGQVVPLGRIVDLLNVAEAASRQSPEGAVDALERIKVTLDPAQTNITDKDRIASALRIARGATPQGGQ